MPGGSTSQFLGPLASLEPLAALVATVDVGTAWDEVPLDATLCNVTPNFHGLGSPTFSAQMAARPLMVSIRKLQLICANVPEKTTGVQPLAALLAGSDGRAEREEAHNDAAAFNRMLLHAPCKA